MHTNELINAAHFVECRVSDVDILFITVVLIVRGKILLLPTISIGNILCSIKIQLNIVVE